MSRMRFSPSGELEIDSTASAWVWSTYRWGRIACSKRLDRGRGRAGAQRVRGELVDHLRVGERRQRRQASHVVEVDRREAGRLDRLQVPAAALHVEDVVFLAEQVLLAQLDRGVAAAVQHERLVAPEQARGVHARPQRAVEPRGLGVVPQAFMGELYFCAMPRIELLDWESARAEASRIRMEVFVREQRVPAEIEMDERDAACLHALAYVDGKAVGTGRLLPDGHIGRMAVLKASRALGVGGAILERLVEEARRRGMREVGWRRRPTRSPSTRGTALSWWARSSRRPASRIRRCGAS
jgi:GNAT superfamily N-acetyltransferase